MPRGSSHSDPDAAARHAARLVLDGVAPDLAAALRTAGLPITLRRLAARHLDAMRHAVGEASDRRDRHEVMLEVAVAVMEGIEDLEERLADQGMDFRGVRLAGPLAAARGWPGETIHLRHHGNRTAEDLAVELDDLGAAEVRVVGLRTRFGMLRSIEGVLDAESVVIRRCPVGQVPVDAGHLLDGRPVPLADLPAARRLLDRRRPNA